MSVSIRHI